MRDAILGSPRSIMRRMAVTNVSNIWDLCRDEIERLKETLYPKIGEQAKEYMEQSYNGLAQVIASLNAGDYIIAEQPDVFKQLITRLNGSFKSLLLAYIIPNSIRYGSDNIENLTEAFYRAIETKLHRRRLCNYAGVTKLINFVRNHEEHDHQNRPEDLVTGKRSFGNLYTIASILILSLYAYIEILRFWVEAEEA